MYQLASSPSLMASSPKTGADVVEVKSVLVSEEDLLQRFRTAFAALARGHLSEAQVALSFLSGKFDEVFSGTLAKLLEGHTERLIEEIEALVGAYGSVVAGGRPPRKLSRHAWEPILSFIRSHPPRCTPSEAPGVIRAKVPLSGPPRDFRLPSREGAGHSLGALMGRVVTL